MFRRTDQNRVVVLAVLILAVILALIGIVKPVSGLTQRLTAALAVPSHAAGSWLGDLFNKPDDPRAAELQARLDRLTVENAQLRSLAAENESLKAALLFREQQGDTSVAARVIYEADDGVSRMLVLDRGATDGLKVGQPVIAGNGVIVGKLAVVRQRTAKVMLLSDSRSRLAVTVQNETETLGILEGDRGLSLVMKLVPQTEDLQNGQTVITSGLEPGIRRGLAVGTIEQVNRPPRQPFQSATVGSFSAWRHPLLVQVIIAEEDEEST